VTVRYNDMQQQQRASSRAYIDSRWRDLSGTVESTKSTILNYLFVLNTGGLAAGLAYIATKQSNWQTTAAILCCAGGILAITLRGALDYYGCEWAFSKFREAVSDLYDGRVEWDEFLKRKLGRAWFDWVLHVLGWVSGVLFFVGLGFGIAGIS
jgi:hypothetical protein